jgi:hypothetical protein
MVTDDPAYAAGVLLSANGQARNGEPNGDTDDRDEDQNPEPKTDPKVGPKAPREKARS